MGIDLKTDQETPTSPIATPSVRAPEASAVVVPIWRRRRYQAAALIVIVAFAAALVANGYLSRQYSPEGAANQYLAALKAGDTAAAWASMQVATPTGSPTVSLTDEAALKSAFAAAQPGLQSFAVGGATRIDDSTNLVSVSYHTSGGTKQAKLLVQRSAENHFGIYAGWQVVVTPTILQISLPQGSTGVTIDGKALDLPAGKSTVAVLPVVHRIHFNASSFYSSQDVRLDALFLLGEAVPYQPQLSDTGLTAVKSAVKAAFVTCSQQTQPYQLPDGGCPQTANTINSGQWTLFGDPTQDLAVSFDSDMNATAAGHYAMVFSYQKYGLQREPDASAYTAGLTMSSTGVTVGAIARTQSGVPALQRPVGATDDLAKSIVSKAFAQCAAITATYAANCPQQMFDVDVSGLKWSLAGDPLSSATVTFDGSTGIFTVHGSFAMSASYVSFGFSKSQTSLSTAYDAYLLWDGQTLQLITIESAN